MTELDSILLKFETSEDDDGPGETEISVSKLGMTKSQMAFKLINKDKSDSLDSANVYDLFLMLGYTFQQTDIDRILASSVEDKNGRYTVDTLIDAFRQWKEDQINIEDLKTSYLMLSQQKRLLQSFGASAALVQVPNDPVEAWLMQPTCLHATLDEILHNESGNGVLDEEVLHLAQEMSSCASGQISFRDFLSLFES